MFEDDEASMGGMGMQKQDWFVLVLTLVVVTIFVSLGPYGKRTDIQQANQCEVTRNPAGYKGGALTELSNDCKQ
ncbi:MAG: hypothetical protein KDD37_00875 [Bdellovibrionales bacterium]|nr:hypothetical protein [Bdellovibrionales bacterium]